MISRPRMLIVVAIVLVVALATGSLVHSFVPHKHSHDGEPVSAVWDSLHSALRGEDKKALDAMAAALVSFVSFSLLLLVLAIGRILSRSILMIDREPGGLAYALQRGVVMYRRFG